MFYFIKIKDREGKIKTSLRFQEKHRALQVFEYMADLCDESEAILLMDNNFTILDSSPCRGKVSMPVTSNYPSS